ncbi:MAG: AAA family ATPase [Acidimicrobiales bacterium]
MPVVVVLPASCLVVLVGVSGSGKSTFAARHFRPTEVLSSDRFRGLVADDENDQSATADAFEALRAVAGLRLAAGRLTVVDATSVQAEARARLLALAARHGVPAVAVVLDVAVRVCAARNAVRAERSLPVPVLRAQRSLLLRTLASIGSEGFDHVVVMRGVDEVDAAVVVRRA